MIRIVMALFLCLLIICCGNSSSNKNGNECIPDSLSVLEEMIAENTDTIPLYAKIIIDAYPDFDIQYADNRLVFADGSSVIYDDGTEKSFIEKLDNCDIEDMFSINYEIDSLVPSYLSDGGRGRCEELFKKMYGNSDAAVRNNLVSVDWLGKKIQFTKVNDAAEQLKKVAEELLNLPQFKKYLTNATTFYWRKVRGSNRQSAHSYGIAIDINVAYSNYWLWANPKRSETDKIKYQNRIPLEIVKIFEKYGFIWGGRWYHYDTMHFEYRPEILKTDKSL